MTFFFSIRLPTTRTNDAWLYEPVCIGYGTIDHLFSKGSYCGHVIGTQPVEVIPAKILINEHKMRVYQLFKTKVLQSPGLFMNLNKLRNKYFVAPPRRKCLEQIDDIYCHHYFKRCFIDSWGSQMLCREACEELIFQVCDREFKEASDFNKGRDSRKDFFGFYWDIIDCTRLPFRNESNNCYYPDKVRGR